MIFYKTSSARKQEEFYIYGFFLLVLALRVFSGFLAGNVASYKGPDGSTWFLVGFLLGPLGLVAPAELSDSQDRTYSKSGKSH